MNLKKAVKIFFRFFGFYLTKKESSQNFNFILERVLKYYQIDTVIDIGANTGQFAEDVFSTGYKGRVISFEPQNEAYRSLLKKSKNKHNWQTYNCAIGRDNRVSEINISENSVSSSILEAKPDLNIIDKSTAYIGKQKIDIKTIENFLTNDEVNNLNVLLKMDVQGYEKEILIGNEEVIKKCKVIQIELSYTTLYEDAVSAEYMINWMISWGFKLHFIYPEFFDQKNGKLLEATGIFIRN